MLLSAQAPAALKVHLSPLWLSIYQEPPLVVVRMVMPLRYGQLRRPFAFGTERRRHPRISAPFPTQVLVTDANGARCTLEARLHNLSAGGLYLRLAQRLEPGTLVYVVVQYAHPPEGALVHLAMQGVVRRVQPETYGQSGVAVQFTQHQFL
jgi:hypothetical protein